ncbi:MAG: hypothetical protein R2793_00445 [Flavobacteriaceae bacterium]
MNDAYHILDEQLPIAVDFKQLKNEGLSFIQAFDGVQWTNLNASDPGVTILDQLVFALTELGYCASFPMKDILTRQNGSIKAKNQFFKPQDILTTAPMTQWDYVTFLVDRVQGVQNAIFLSSKTAFPSLSIVEVFLKAISANKSTVQQGDLCNEAFYALNRSRNLGQVFSMPAPLEQVPIWLKGELVFDGKQNPSAILKAAQEAIDDYLFLKIKGKTFDTLEQKGHSINTIFNGPKLTHGWILHEGGPSKRDEVYIHDLQELLLGVAGVVSVENISFAAPSDPNCATALPYQLLDISLSASLLHEKGLTLFSGNEQIRDRSLEQVLKKLELSTSKAIPPTVDKATMAPKFPKGSFREIEDYYSIQHTFPEIFGLGSHGVAPGTSPSKKAQTKQLKGYLTLFDQLIANQFSQLAHLDQLFSFSNPVSGVTKRPSSKNYFLQKFEKSPSMYPVPFKSFSPTYFYQFLYDVPEIKDILMDATVFDFSEELISIKELEEKSWESYQKDPYNSYSYGLMQLMEEEKTNVERRNTILDHLLARHGESPALLDYFIQGAEITGETKKDAVLFKSLYLQNFEKLSYYRFKGYNYLQAAPLEPEIKNVSEKRYEKLTKLFSKDFLVRAKKINKQGKIKKKDLVNFSTLELKLHLLFGLDFQYQRYIVEHFENDAFKEECAIAQWLSKQRKGCILVETKLLFQEATFKMIFSGHGEVGVSWETKQELTLYDISQLETWFRAQTVSPFTGLQGTVDKTIQEKTYTFEKKAYEPTQSSGYATLGFLGNLYLEISFDSSTFYALSPDYLTTDVFIVFPEFICQPKTTAFPDRVAHFLDANLPVGVAGKVLCFNKTKMMHFIHAFANWHNSKRFRFSENERVGSPSQKPSSPSAQNHGFAIWKSLVLLKTGMS